MDSAIETYQLTKVYEKPQGWRRATRLRSATAVSKVTIKVQTGELFGLLGPNGAGKTTLVKMLCTLILPSSGTARVAGHPLVKSGEIRQAVGLVVSDQRSFYWRLSGRRNLDFFASMYGLHGSVATERVNEVLKQVGLLEEAEKRFSHYSGGMKQRLAIARSLLHAPRLLFLDEPSRSLDPIATEQLHSLLRKLMTQHEMSIFLITHDLSEAEKLCHRVALMHKGHVRAMGKPVDLRRQLDPQRHYIITADELEGDTLRTLTDLVPNLRYQPSGKRSQLFFRAAEDGEVFGGIIDTLRHSQSTIYMVDSAPPTLEEVFAHFTKDEVTV